MKYEITFINEQKYPKKTQLSQTLNTTASSFKDLISEELKDHEGYWSDKDLVKVLIKKAEVTKVDAEVINKNHKLQQVRLPELNKAYKSTGEWIFGSIAADRGVVMGYWKKHIVVGTDRGVHSIRLANFWEYFEEYSKEEYPSEKELKDFIELQPGIKLMDDNWPKI